jgi:hypothetical protein
MIRYTAVFEWPDGQEPAISNTAAWLGGKLISIQFSDALAQRDRYREALERIADDDFDGLNAQEIAESALYP